MLSQKSTFGLIFAMLISMPIMVFANSDITKIGIRVLIKAKQDCNYIYANTNKLHSNVLSSPHLFDCDFSSAKIKQQIEQVSIASTHNNQQPNVSKHMRVIKVVQ